MWTISKFLRISKSMDSSQERHLDVSKVDESAHLSVMEDACLRLGESNKKAGSRRRFLK